MSEPDNTLSAIELSADDYADAAATDTPPVSRTHQTEAAFQAIKSTYSAKIDGDKAYADLIAAVPVLAGPLPPQDSRESHSQQSHESSANGDANGSANLVKMKLTKKHAQLLGYAVGEIYFDRDYAGVVELCERVRMRCDIDGKVGEDLEKWIERARARLG